jgi:hypothetical protein
LLFVTLREYNNYISLFSNLYFHLFFRFAMKQHLFFLGSFLLIATSGFAQSRATATIAKKHSTTPAAAQEPIANGVATSTPLRQKLHRNNGANSTNAAITLVPIGSTAINAFTGHEPRLHPLAYDPSTNLLVLTHRGGTLVGSTPTNTLTNTGNQIHIDVSTDGGTTWTAQQPVTNPNAPTLGTPNYNTRYPNGCIWNPTGNTDPANAKIVFAGPATTIPATGTTTWTSSYLGWANLPTGNNPNYTFETAIAGLPTANISDFPQSMTNLNNGFGYLSSRMDVAAQKRLFIFALIDFAKIVPNGSGGFTRSVKFTSAPIACPTPADTAHLGFDMAFGPDGNTGYITHRTPAIDAQHPKDYNRSPVLYKTTDAGETWTRQPTLDLQAIQMIIDSARHINGDTTTILPIVTDSRLVVDNMGRCHIFAEVNSSFFRCADSITSTIGNLGTKYFAHFIVDGNNVQTNFVFRSSNTDADFGALANRGDFNEQIQAGRSADGTRIFFTAQQTPTAGAANTANNAPDLFAYAYRTTDGKFMPLKNFTAGTDAEAGVFFSRLSPVAMNVAGGHKLPISIMQPGQIAGAPSDTGVPDFFFLDGVEIADADYTMTMPSPAVPATYTNGGACSQLVICIMATERGSVLEGKVSFMPNPTSGNLNVDLSKLTAAATITVSDVMGKIISTATNQTGNVAVDLTAQAAGIYFVTIQNAEGKLTAKIAVTR